MNNLKEKFSKENVIKGLKWFFKSFIWLGVLLLVLDVVTKHIALNAFGGWDLFAQSKPNVQDVVVIPNFISFTITFNTGAAWGIFGNLEDLPRRIILIGISVVMSAAFLGVYIKKFKSLNGWYKALLLCLAAGAIGNLIDRACYPDGKVIDFLKFTFIDFPVFNVADAVLVVSIIILIIYMIVEEIMAYVKKRKNAAEPQLIEKNEENNDPETDQEISEKEVEEARETQREAEQEFKDELNRKDD